MTNIYFIAGIIIECIVLALLAVFKKLSGKAFAAIAVVTALCCGVVGFMDRGTQKAQEQTDIRSSLYMAARLIEEDQPAEALELITDISDRDGSQYGSRSMRALAYNLNGAYIASESVLEGGDNNEMEEDLLESSSSRTRAGEELRSGILENAYSLIAATDKEIAGWETEMKVRFMGLKMTDEEKALTDNKLALAKDAMRDYRNEEAFKIMTGNTSGIREAIIVSEMYKRGYSNLIMKDTDEEYAQLWKEAADLQAELNIAAAKNTAEKTEAAEEEAEDDNAAEEYEKIDARYRIAQTALSDETIRRSINYLETFEDAGSKDAAGYELQKAMLYFSIRQQDDARKCLDKVFFGEPLSEEDWLGNDIESFKKAFIIYLSDSMDPEYSVLFDNMMKSLYQGLFEGNVSGQFKTFVMEYMKEKMSGLTIRHVDTSQFPLVTADLYATSNDIVLEQGKLTVADNGGEIKDFTLEQIEVTDLSIVFVLDKSGSMSGSNIEQSKEAIKNCISQLESDVMMGLVSFDNSAYVECALTDSATAVRSCVDGIQATGGTNISAGLNAGIELLSGRGGTKVIILLSDGRGSDTREQVNSATAAAASQGITIYTVGLPGCDEDTLQSISKNTEGQFIMVENTAMLSSTYNDIQNAMTNSYRLTYTAADDKEYRKVAVKNTDNGNEAARYYSTAEEKAQPEKETERDDTQAADYYRQIGGSEGGR
ncbi:MAG: VWA domain-containing protein [Solobacterium sp.]|nr:VWA domain-containing protein [Solobacterium sp.]